MTRAASQQAHRPEGWWAWPPIYAVVLYGVLFIPGLPWWTFPTMALVCGIAGRTVCHYVLDWDTYGELSNEAGYWGLLAGVGGAAWLWWAYDPHVGGALGAIAHWQWLALWLAVFGSWWVTLWVRAPRYAARPPEPVVTSEVPTPYARILELAGVRDAKVSSVDVGDAVDTVHVEPADDASTITYRAFSAKTDAIARQCALHFRQEGLRIAEDDVNTQPGADAAEFLLMVTRQRLLTGTIPFEADPRPGTSCGPQRIGLYEDLVPADLTFFDPEKGARHAELLGKDGSGKGELLKILEARFMGTNDCEVWLVGTSKLVKAAKLWLAAWLSMRADRPPVDRVAGENIYHALEGLADALHYVKLLNTYTAGNDARVASPGDANLVIAIDESGRLLKRKERIQVYDGRWMTAGEIVSEIRQESRSSGVLVVTANQDNLYDSSGANGSGSEGKRNVSINVVFEVRMRQDSAQPLDGLPTTVDPTRLRDYMCYIRPDIEKPRPLRAKSYRLRDGDIDELAIRFADYRHGLNPKLTARLKWYGHRWSVNRHRELWEWCEAQGWTWPGDGPSVDAEYEADVEAIRKAAAQRSKAPKFEPWRPPQWCAEVVYRNGPPAGSPGESPSLDSDGAVDMEKSPAPSPSGSPSEPPAENTSGYTSNPAGDSPTPTAATDHPAPTHAAGDVPPGSMTYDELTQLIDSLASTNPAAAALLRAYRDGTLDPELESTARQLADHLEPPMPEPQPDWTDSDASFLASLGVVIAPTQNPAAAASPARPSRTGAPTAGAGEDTPSGVAGEDDQGMPILDGSDLRAIGERMLAAERERVAGLPPARLEDPLGLILAILQRSQPAEFWLTETLATAVRVLSAPVGPERERVKAELADPAVLRRATEQLGRDLFRQTGIESGQAPRSFDPQRRRGYTPEALFDAGVRLMRAQGAA